MIVRRLLASAALIGFAASAFAQTQWVGREQTLSRHVQAGGTVRVFTYVGFKRTCEPLPAPQIAMRVAPLHGSVAFQPGVVTVKTVREGMPDCSGRQMPGTAMFYTAQPGFHGQDQFQYDVLMAEGTPRHDTAVIDVR